MIKRFASHYLYLTKDDFYRLQVVELQEGLVLRYWDLTEESHSVSWLGGIIILSANPEYKMKSGMLFSVLVESLTSDLASSSSIYAYLLEGVDLQTHTFLPEVTLKRLF